MAPLNLAMGLETFKLPSPYMITATAPHGNFYSDSELEYMRMCFNSFKTSYNRVLNESIEHRICLMSNYTETFLKDFEQILLRMVNYGEKPLIIRWNFTIMKRVRNDNGRIFFCFSEQHYGELG